MSFGIIGTVASIGVGMYSAKKQGKAAEKAADSASYAANLQADIAQDQWDSYKSIYQPLEKRLVSDAEQADSPDKFMSAASQASATVGQQFGKAVERLDRQPGLDPSSASYMAARSDLELGRAAADATAQNLARKQVEDDSYIKRHDAASLGKGLASSASTGFANVATARNAQANTAYDQAAAQARGMGAGVSQIIGAVKDSGYFGGGGGSAAPAGLFSLGGGAVGGGSAFQSTANPYASGSFLGLGGGGGGSDIFFGN